MLKPTRFPCTIFPSKWVTTKYKILIVKMLEDQFENKVSRFDLQKMFNVELILSFHCILPLLELVHTLIKYAQGKDVQIFDSIEAIRCVISKLYELYIDMQCTFKDEVFNAFHSPLVRKYDGWPLVFIKFPTIDDNWCV